MKCVFFNRYIIIGNGNFTYLVASTECILTNECQATGKSKIRKTFTPVKSKLVDSCHTLGDDDSQKTIT